MKYVFKYLFISFFLLSGITFFLLGFTEKGLLLELRYAAGFIPGEIKIERVSGTLFSEFSLEHIFYQYQGNRFSIESIHFKWHPTNLLLGYLDIDTLAIKNPIIQLNSKVPNNNFTNNNFANNNIKTRILDKTFCHTSTQIPDKTFCHTSTQIPDKTFCHTSTQIPDKTFCHTSTQIPDKTFCHTSTQIPDKKNYCHTSTQIPDKKNYCHTSTQIPDKKNYCHASMLLAGIQDSIETRCQLKACWHDSHFSYSESAFRKNSNTSINLGSLRSAFHLLRYIHIKNVILDHFYLQKDKQLIYLNGTLADHWNFEWSLKSWNLKSQNISETSGYLQGEGRLTGPRFRPVIDAVINGNKIAYNNQTIGTLNTEAHIVLQPNTSSHLKINASNIAIDTYHFKHLTINTTATPKYIKNEWVTALQLNANKQFTLDTIFSFPTFSGSYTNQSFIGKCHFIASDLSVLTQFLPNIKNPRGILQGNGTFQGTLKKPEFQMALILDKGSFTLPLLGIQPINLLARGEIDNSLHLTFNGTFQSGLGKAQLQGNYPIAQVNAPLTLSIQGTDLQIVHLPEYHVSISPRISLVFAYPALKVNGDVIISEASMMPKNTNTAVELPDEAIFVNQQKNITSVDSPLQLTLQLGIQLSDKVNVDYANLQAKLLGHLIVSKMPDSPPQATGELYTAQGKYTAYGQKLMIETGRLIYTGNPLTNPGLDIRAVKKVKRVITQNANGFTTESSFQNVSYDTEISTVGVQVLGTAERPKITLFSTPADLSQADILSYLVLGVPQSQASAAQGSVLFAALSAYNPDAPHALGFTNTLQNSLGLNELSISSVETFNPSTQTVESNTSFVVGKQITQKLSIHYSIGLFNPISILNLRYRISKHWTVQSETSSIDSGADILYGFERD